MAWRDGWKVQFHCNGCNAEKSSTDPAFNPAWRGTCLCGSSDFTLTMIPPPEKTESAPVIPPYAARSLMR